MNKWYISNVMSKTNSVLRDRLEIAAEHVAHITDLNVAGQGNQELKAVDFGQHRGSIFSEVVSDHKAIAGFDGSAGHSLYVEMGTAKMRARPSLQRALLDNKEVIKNLLEIQ